MSAAGTLFRKELRETLHTWRLWVLPGIFAFIGVSSPLMAALLPAILRWSESQGSGVSISVHEPVARDAYMQFVGSLQELAVLAIIVTAAGLICGEARSGSAALVLAKPLGRGAFVLVKFAAFTLLLVTVVALSILLCVACTAAVFGLGPAWDAVRALLVWLPYAFLFTAFTLLLSAALRSQLAAAGGGIGLFIAFSLLGIADPVARVTPMGIPAMMTEMVKGSGDHQAWPLVTALALTAVCVTGAVAVFHRREL